MREIKMSNRVLIVDDEVANLALYTHILQRRFEVEIALTAENALGSLREWAHGGRVGNWLTVNGQEQPEIPLYVGERVRLRLINVCNASILSLGLKGLNPVVIAYDGQPVEPAAPGEAPFLLSPAQRIDLVVDVSAKAGAALLAFEDDQVLELAKFTIRTPSSPVAGFGGKIARLPDNPLPEFVPAGAMEVELKMEGGAMGAMRSAIYKGEKLAIGDLVKVKQIWALAGTAGLPEAPLFTARRGQSVIINMINDTAWPHPMHIHGFHYKVVERNTKPVAGAPWRDTELLLPRDRLSLGFVADNPGKWLLHCHNLEHTAAGMITWFEVEA